MGDWVIAGQPKGVLPEIGKVYGVRHSRKGTFQMKVTRVSDEWLTGNIIEGVAKALMSYNVRDVGEEITIRDSMTYLIPVTP